MNMRGMSLVRHAFFAIQSGELSVMAKNKYAAKREFYKSIQDLAEHPVVLEMKKYPQHGKTNCYKHLSQGGLLQLLSL